MNIGSSIAVTSIVYTVPVGSHIYLYQLDIEILAADFIFFYAKNA